MGTFKQELPGDLDDEHIIFGFCWFADATFASCFTDLATSAAVDSAAQDIDACIAANFHARGCAFADAIIADLVVSASMAAAAAIVRVVHQIVAKIVITEGFTRAFNAFPIDADSRISTALAACSAMSLVILNIGTIAPAWLLAFFA